MSNKNLTVWDCEGTATSPLESTIYWSGYSQQEKVNTVPTYLEKKSDELRARYLSFVHQLGELNISGNRLIDHLEIEKNFSFWWMTLIAEKSYLKSPRIFDCLRLLAFDMQLDEMKPKAIKLVSNDSTLARAMHRCARSKGIPFKWEKSIYECGKLYLKGFYKRIPYNFRAIVFFLIHIFKRWQLIKIKNKWFSGKNSMFLFSYFVHLDLNSCKDGKFYSHQWETLPSKLCVEGKKLNFIHHFIQSPIVPNAMKGIQYVKKFNNQPASEGSHSFLDSWLSLKVCLDVISKFFTLSIRMRLLQPAMEKALHNLPYSYLWPLLDKDWNNSIHGPIGIRNTLFLRLIDNAIDSLPEQSTGLYLLEGQGWERAFIHYWRKHKHGRLIGVCHATISYWYLMYFNDKKVLNTNSKNAVPRPDYIAVNGKAMRDIMENAGYEPENLIDVEAIRYFHLDKIKRQRKLNLEDIGKKKLFVIGDYITEVTKSLLSLLNQLDNSVLLKYDIIFKMHPAVDQIEKGLYPNLNYQETNLHLKEILPTVDIVLSSINTAAAIESFAAGLPVITMLDSNNFNSSPLRDVNGAVFISNQLQLGEALETLSNDYSLPNKDEYFWLDSEITRWKALLLD